MPDYLFHPNYILSNRHIYGYDPDFDIDAFLKAPMKGVGPSPLLKWKAKDGRGIAQVIKDACTQETIDKTGVRRNISINPRILLATIQKESSGVTRPLSPRLSDWALGFGADDSGNRPEKYRGFEKQIDAAALRFDRYYTEHQNLVRKPMPVDGPLARVHGARVVTPVNIATVACYRYTPWVGDRQWGRYKTPYGNLLLHRIWIKFFGSPW